MTKTVSNALNKALIRYCKENNADPDNAEFYNNPDGYTWLCYIPEIDKSLRLKYICSNKTVNTYTFDGDAFKRY